MSREVGRPASRASTSWLAAQIRMSASQMVARPCSGTSSTEIRVSPIRKSIGAIRRDLARLKKGQDMRSCASRGAGLAGTERNRSSCVRSIRVTAEDDGRRGTASALRLHVEPLGGKADPGARIGGRAPSAKFRPGVERVDRIDDAAAQLVEIGAGPVAAMLFEGARGTTRSEE